jgi:preprotein translocase SecE subunit
MDRISDLIQQLFGLELEGELLIIFLIFLAICVTFLAWGIYYAIGKRAIDELGKISWASRKKTLVDSTFILVTIVIVCFILFGYDFGLDKIVDVIIENAE